MLKSKFDKHFIWGLVFILALVSAIITIPQIGHASTQASYYVSPTGSDSNSGTTASTPFATITKARDVVRTINGSMTGDIYIYLMNGTFTLSSTLALSAADSGTNGYNIIYKAYTGATPIISGGVDLTNGWTLYDSVNNIYKKTGVNWNFRQLYVNDQRGVRARYPNVTDPLTGAPYLTATNNSYPYTVNTADIGSWANLGTAEMVLVNHWSQYHGRIAGYSGSTVTFKSPESGFAWNHHNQGTTYYYFENALALLDTGGEWFLDSAASTLYYKPRSGETMNTTQIIAPKVETLVNIQGSSSTNKAHNIQFYGINFKHSNWLAPNSYGYVDLQAGFRIQTVSGNNNSDIVNTARYSNVLAAVQLKYTSNIKLDHNTFKFSGGWGVMGNEGTDHTSIVSNTFQNNAAGGVAMGIVGDQWANQAAMEGQSTFDSITDNTVDSNGLDYAEVVGIGAMLPQNMTIARNEVKNQGYTGITIGWNWEDNDHGMTNNQIYQNNVHDVMKLLDDGAGIYTLGLMGGNSSFDHNYIHDIVRSAFQGGYPIAALYFDNGSTLKIGQYNVINNTINAWYALNPPNHNNVFQNNYYNVSAGTWDPSNTFINNTLVSGQSWPQAALDIISAAAPGATPTPIPTSTPTPTPTPIPIPGNLALNKSVSAYWSDGSAATTMWEPLTNAVDGNPATYTHANGQYVWQLQVDLGSSQSNGRIITVMPSNLYATAFDLKASTDGINFTTVKSITGFAGGTSDNTITPTTARYIRVVAITPNGVGQVGGEMAISELGVYGINLAFNKPVSAYWADGSLATTMWEPVTNAVDGDMSTFTHANGQYVWQLQVDLGSSQSIDRIITVMPSNLYATAFDLKTSTDGTNFSIVKSISGFAGGTSDNMITATTARYIRVVAITPNGVGQTGAEMGISELQVYGSGTGGDVIGSSPNPSGDKLELNVTNGTGVSNKYIYKKFSNLGYTFQAGDYIQYDTKLLTNAGGIGGIEIINTDGSYFRDTAGWQDQNGVNGHPGTNLSIAPTNGYNQWIHRKLAVPSSLIGRSVSNWDIVGENDSDSISYKAQYDNIVVTDGAGIVKAGGVIFRDAANFNSTGDVYNSGVTSSTLSIVNP